MKSSVKFICVASILGAEGVLAKQKDAGLSLPSAKNESRKRPAFLSRKKKNNLNTAAATGFLDSDIPRGGSDSFRVTNDDNPDLNRKILGVTAVTGFLADTTRLYDRFPNQSIRVEELEEIPRGGAIASATPDDTMNTVVNKAAATGFLARIPRGGSTDSAVVDHRVLGRAAATGFLQPERISRGGSTADSSPVDPILGRAAATGFLPPVPSQPAVASVTVAAPLLEEAASNNNILNRAAVTGFLDTTVHNDFKIVLESAGVLGILVLSQGIHL